MENVMVYLGAGLAIGLGWVGVAIAQGHLAKTSMDVLGKNPKLAGTLLVYTILGIALVESAAIYSLVVAMQIISTEGLSNFAAIGAGLAIGLTSFGAGMWEGKLVSGALEAINRNPENKGKVLSFMILFVALVEVIAIYGLIIAFQLIGTASAA